MNFTSIRDRGLACLVFIHLSALAAAGPANALVYSYENTTSGTLSSAATPCANPLVRSFTVADSFTVATIGVALNVTHPSRGDLRVVLVSPSGTTLQIITERSDTDDNYDILMSTNTEGGIDDGDIDATADPIYNRLVSVAGMNFYTGNSVGTWSLRICDTVAADNGTFNRARLILTSSVAASPSCNSTVTYDWATNGASVPFTSATVNGVTISLSSAVNFGASGSTSNFTTLTSTNGNHTGYYALTMDAPTGTDSENIGERVVFTYSPPVRDLTFSLLDVDWINAGWEDQALIIGTDASGNQVPYSFTNHPNNQVAGNLSEGDISAATTSPDGNVDYVFNGAVSTLTLEYSQGNEPTVSAVFQVIGISDFVACAFDMGDGPDTYGTSLGANGARHVIGDRSLYLGSSGPDGESDGSPGATALTDDNNMVSGVDDEDGVVSFPNYAGGGASYTVSVNAVNLSTTTAASLVGYIDWNRDGDYDDADEQSSTVVVPANTTSTTAFNVTWPTPPTNAGGTSATFARFRIAYVATEAESPIGLANSGEVEDYPIGENVLPVTLSSFTTEAGRGSRVTVVWTTETETSTVGFKVHGWDGRGWTALTEKMVPTRSLDSLAPQRYEIEIEDAGYVSYALEDVDLHGVGTVHGPFEARVAYGREPELQPIDWAGVHAELADLESARRSSSSLRAAGIPLPSGIALADLSVDGEGIHRVRHEDLLAAGIDLTGFPLSRLVLVQARGGKEVPLWVQAGATPGVFGPDAYFEFRGVPTTGSLYTRNRNYRLIAGTPGDRVKLRDGTPGSGGPTSYSATTAVERDLVYSFGSPNGDPWFEVPVLAQGGPVEHSFPIEIDALAASSGRLQVDLWGVTNWPGTTPDHHVELWLNGSRLADDRFDGLTPRHYDLPLPAGLLAEGANELKLRVIGDSGFAFDLVNMDGYSVVHPRRFEARDGQLVFPLVGGPVEVDGLPTPEVVVYSRSGRFRLSNVAVEPSDLGYRARFTVPPLGAGASEAAATVDVVALDALRRPVVRTPRSTPRDLVEGASGEYLVISHPLFLSELGPLVAARESQGYRVKVVDLLDVYQAYSGGEVDPQAIRQYLIEAVTKLGTRMVLLVGGDSYDYLDHLGTGSVSLLPTIYSQTDDLIRYSPADSLLADLNGDGLQDLAIGRLPARTREELQRLIDKTLRYPGTPAGAVFAADRSTSRRYSSTSEELTSHMPASWPVTRAYVDDLNLAGARSTLLDAFSAGPALVNYVGHSGPTVWTFEGLFAASDSAGLGNVDAPSTVIQWGCWNTYHVSPQYDTLAHRLLLEGPQGAAAVIGSSTLTKESSDARLGPELLRRLVGTGQPIGEAILAAKKAVAADGTDLRDVLVGWTLLGDPALVVDR